MALTARTLVVAHWGEVPRDISTDCMLLVSPGVHRHIRTNTTIVDLSATSPAPVRPRIPVRPTIRLARH